MEKSKNIDAAHWFSNRQVLGILGAAIIATFYVTVNYAGFEQLKTRHENDIEALRAEFQSKIDEFEAKAVREFDILDAQEAKDEEIEDQRFKTLERRLEKKIEKLNQLEEEVNQLQQKGSDAE